ncbi:unnamed protein product [Vicia faba]|uniref:Uncharacterized protein n=1 Tax=Vicia faba TaxID=3906 RepID=A0AAV0YR64_VICFA|nr:unnamed protein product [Vicia faba]
MSNVPLRFVPMRNIHENLISPGEDSQETNLINPDDDKDVADILYDMLAKPQMHKENDDFHEDVEVDTTIANDDHALEDVKTLGKGVNEIIYTTNGKKNRLISKNTQLRTSMIYADEDESFYDLIAHIEVIKWV